MSAKLTPAQEVSEHLAKYANGVQPLSILVNESGDIVAWPSAEALRDWERVAKRAVQNPLFADYYFGNERDRAAYQFVGGRKTVTTDGRTTPAPKLIRHAGMVDIVQVLRVNERKVAKTGNAWTFALNAGAKFKSDGGERKPRRDAGIPLYFALVTPNERNLDRLTRYGPLGDAPLDEFLATAPWGAAVQEYAEERARFLLPFITRDGGPVTETAVTEAAALTTPAVNVKAERHAPENKPIAPAKREAAPVEAAPADPNAAIAAVLGKFGAALDAISSRLDKAGL